MTSTLKLEIPISCCYNNRADRGHPKARTLLVSATQHSGHLSGVSVLNKANPDNRFYVYAHTRNDSGAVFYIGKGCGRRAYVLHGRSSLWTRISSKYGFSVKILKSGLTEDQAFAEEAIAISEHSGLCNHTLGGEGISGYAHTEETRRRLSKAHSGRKQCPNVVEARTKKLRGKKRSKEFCEAMRIINTGRTASSKTRAKMGAARNGRKPSPETVRKIAEANRGAKRSDEARKRMSDAQPKRPVKCISTGETHGSLTEAAIWLRGNGYPKATATGVWHCATGRYKRSYGMEWSYVDV